MNQRHDSNAYSSYATMSDSPVTLPTLSDVGRLPEFMMAITKPEVDVTIERQDSNTISTVICDHAVRHGYGSANRRPALADVG